MVESAPAPVLLVVWHSLTGATEAAVQALCAGAREQAGDAVCVRALHVRDAAAADVLACDALVLATPETLGSISGLMKDFLDRSYYPLLGQRPGLPAALVVVAGSDGDPTQMQLRRVLAGWAMREVCAPLRLCTRAQSAQAIAAAKQLSDEQLAAAREFGATLAAGLVLGVF